MRRLREDDDDRSEEGFRARKQRKQRPCFSCAECRRLKMKCDRQVPCSNCLRRHRVEFCVAATNNPGTSKSALPSILLCRAGLQDQQQGYQGPPETNTTRHENAQPFDPNLNQHTINRSHHVPSHSNAGVPNQVNPLTLLAHALEPYSVQAPSPHTPASAPSGRLEKSAHSINTGTSASSNPARYAVEDDRENGSYGTLMLGKRGRSKYLGPTAGSEWLKESETQDVPDTPCMTRAPSPALPQGLLATQPSVLSIGTTTVGFPFNASPAHISTRELLACLPSRDEAWTLVESYYRYCAWHHNVAPKPSFEKTFDRVFKRAESGCSSPPINAQEIALVFIIMAQGTMFNIEMPNCDSSAEEWLHLSERSLVKGEFLSNNTVAGLQTLHLMAHLRLQLDEGRRGDSAWPLWGLVMRLIQAMGMHRDGDRWNLPQDVVEERRKVFWECNSADIFQAHCFSRPSAINPEHCDTAFPSEPVRPNGEKSYSILRFELSQISSEILNMAMKVRRPAYSEVTDLDLRLSEFEHNIPYSLRCRAALLATPSRYPQLETAISASPEPSRMSLTISFQQTNLALNVSETIINLHRPYYARVLHDANHGESVYKPSFYIVIERCAIIISIVTDIHTRFPAVTTRQWNFWYHVFGSALCLGTLVLRDPANVMASFALTQIDAAISLFTSLLQHGAHPLRYKRNLQWLLNLRTRALSKISSVSALQRGNSRRDTNAAGQNDGEDGDRDREDDEDVELLGWRTRLIERMGQGHQKTIRTIRLSETPSVSPNMNVTSTSVNSFNPQGQMGISDMANSNPSLPAVNLDSTNELLHDFWDPVLLQDVFGPSQDHQTSLMNTWWDNMPNPSQSRG
ncbi:Fungal-trans domain-containing protein [Fusarium keratoplasticum]|uniref:Fungal-trans domain-containing protein n=1 Tax=Fusarium keratoplasticum TaxID=1328300 RepID=A0ACC0QUW7_9HYPO|nr:Fungal-trans domain-containing protein [Fusarium keratoplasticum]KAI8666838.1 Fungal-trans domain-containing protein [Fusarium keratoplasticum]